MLTLYDDIEYRNDNVVIAACGGAVPPLSAALVAGVDVATTPAAAHTISNPYHPNDHSSLEETQSLYHQSQKNVLIPMVMLMMMHPHCSYYCS